MNLHPLSNSGQPTLPHNHARYDALGRLFTTKTPEGGTTCFGTTSGGSCTANTGYDNFDNLLYRTDARGAITSYTYDGLNRLKGVSYTTTGTTAQSTPSVNFTYGTNASQFNNGALITMTDGVGSENYSYNALEQLTQLQKIISGTTYTTSYQYNIAGELTQITYPSGRVIQQSVDAIGRLCEIAPSTTGCGSATSPFATGYGYNVASQVTGFKYGNGIYASLGFSSDRLQLNCLDYSTTNRNGSCTHDSTTKFGLSYSYGSAGSNNGLMASITDSVDNGRSVAYTYDPLSRLSTALTSGSTNFPQWGLSWGYDRYGNRKSQTLTAGTGYQGSVTADPATNHITGSPYTYDANGNMTNDGSNTLVYDAENKAVSATNQSTSGTYTYDGNGLRVKKVSGSTTTVYIFSGSKVIGEYDNGAAPTAPSREYVYGGGTLLAKIDSSGTKYYHQDHLSNRLVTSSTGTTSEQMGHFPFGDTWYNGSSDKLYFTSYERDSESGNDYAIGRYYVWRLARFLSPDPLSGSSSDPQSLNHYTYAANNPISNTDPSGACVPPGANITGTMLQAFTCPQNTMGQDISLSGGGWSDASNGFWDALIAGDVATFGPSGQYGFSQENWNSPMYGSIGNYTPAPWTILGDIYTNLTGQQFGIEGDNGSGDLMQTGGPTGPANTPQSPQNSDNKKAECMQANIKAVNQKAPNLNVNPSNVTNSFFRNGAWNYDFSVSGATTNDLVPGRYTSSAFNAVTGIGNSLHVPAPGGADPTVYGMSNGNFMFTTHIDSGYATWHSPLGAFIHWVVDVRDKGAHRKPC